MQNTEAENWLSDHSMPEFVEDIGSIHGSDTGLHPFDEYDQPRRDSSSGM